MTSQNFIQNFFLTHLSLVLLLQHIFTFFLIPYFIFSAILFAFSFERNVSFLILYPRKVWQQGFFWSFSFSWVSSLFACSLLNDFFKAMCLIFPLLFSGRTPPSFLQFDLLQLPVFSFQALHSLKSYCLNHSSAKKDKLGISFGWALQLRFVLFGKYLLLLFTPVAYRHSHPRNYFLEHYDLPNSNQFPDIRFKQTPRTCS